jgi:pyrroline-5-carboxylate reductase
MRLGFLGTGTITSAMVTGLSSAGGADSIHLSPRNAAMAADLARRIPGVSVGSTNQEVIDRCDTVVIAVRPQIAEAVLTELQFRSGQNVISLVSGLPVGRLAGLVAPATRISRAVPLPAAARRASPTAIYPREADTVALFALLGAAFAVDTEREFDALCTATATMASYFEFADGAASWLKRQGIAEGQARDYVARIFHGLAETAAESPERSFAELANDHATRGGTNEQVLRHLKEHGVYDRFSEALDGVMRRVTANSLVRDAS